MAKKPGIKLIANNKKAFHDYFIEDTYEAGIALAGTEVKSLRMGKCSGMVCSPPPFPPQPTVMAGIPRLMGILASVLAAPMYRVSMPMA